MRIGVLADIHGNILALEAVLASGPLWPRETLDRLQSLNAATVRGNHDCWVAEHDPAKMGPSDRFALDEMTSEQRRALGALPLRLHVAREVLAFHATPTDDNLYLLEEIEGGRVVRGRPERISERLGDVPARLVLCGHSHRPDIVRLPGGPVILNPGSVGCPAYKDTTHVSESGSPHARYAMVEDRPDGEFSLELIAVSYEHEAAARRAEANDRPEWAYGLRTGFMAALLQ